MKRFFKVLGLSLALASQFFGALAEAQTKHRYFTAVAVNGGQSATNGANLTRYMLAGTRLRILDAQFNVSSQYVYAASNIIVGTPNWTCHNPRLLLTNWQISSSGTINNPGNAINIEKLAFWNSAGTVTTPITIQGSRAYTIPNGGQVWTDPAPVDLTANSTYNIREAYNVAVGGNRVGSSVPPIPGEGFVVSSSDRSSYVDTFTAMGPSLGVGNAFYMPIAMACQGWDGSPVIWMLGDSIGDYLQVNATLADSRGNRSWVEDMLDDSGRRLAYSNWSRVSATPAWYYGSQFLANAIAAFSALGSQPPFTAVLNETVVNSIQGKGVSGTEAQLTALQAAMQANWPGTAFYQTLSTTYTSSTDGWTTTTNQTPNNGFTVGGTRDQVNAWIEANTAFTAYIDPTPVLEANNVWLVPNYSTTLAGGTAVGNAIPANYYYTSASVSNALYLNACPPIGTFLVFEPGTSNQDYNTGAGYGIVSEVNNGTNCFVTLGPATNQQIGWLNSSPIAKAHALNVTVTSSDSIDGLHPTYANTQAAAAYAISTQKPKISK
jgi:hypothetical protein